MRLLLLVVLAGCATPVKFHLSKLGDIELPIQTATWDGARMSMTAGAGGSSSDSAQSLEIEVDGVCTDTPTARLAYLKAFMPQRTEGQISEIAMHANCAGEPFEIEGTITGLIGRWTLDPTLPFTLTIPKTRIERKP